MERAAAALMAFAGACLAQQPVRFAAPDTTLEALYYPAPVSPAPAVVMLHGCSGMWFRPGVPTPSNADWARRLNDAGYAVLMLDSFTPRGRKEVCTQQVRTIRPEAERTGDAHAARQWLAARGEVDAHRVHLIGWSHGGTTALHAVRAGASIGLEGPNFRSVVAFYPGCAALTRRRYEAQVPVLIQAGAADDWTPASHCVSLAARSAGRIAIDVYPGAHHAFDRLGHALPRYRADVRNAASPTGWGATIGPHPEARSKAIVRTIAFLGAGADVPRGTPRDSAPPVQ